MSVSKPVGKFEDAAKVASEEAEITWDVQRTWDPAAQGQPAGAATSSAGGRPEVEATTVALGQACLSKLVSWLGRLVRVLVGVVWFA